MANFGILQDHHAMMILKKTLRFKALIYFQSCF